MRDLIFAACAAALSVHAPAHAQTPLPSADLAAPSCRPLTNAVSSPGGRDARRTPATQVWEEANTGARQRPDREGFEAARYIYTYAAGAIYELAANPNFISAILLQEGETLTNLAAGDTSRWQVQEANSEGLDGARAILLVKPASLGLRTNIVIVTNRRTYLVEALSRGGDVYSAEIAWCYPRSGEGDGVHRTSALNFDYSVRVMRGSRPVWTPVRIYDDGRRTWIEFAPETEASDLPPLFVVTGEGAELVNYRVDGRTYVVDRVFDRAELRLGVRAPHIVRIERDGLNATRRHPRRGRP